LRLGSENYRNKRKLNLGYLLDMPPKDRSSSLTVTSEAGGTFKKYI
jgi:hypothetical protein